MNEKRVREIIDEVIWNRPSTQGVREIVEEELRKQSAAPTVEEVMEAVSKRIRFPSILPAPPQPLLNPAMSVPVVLPEDSIATNAQTVLYYLQAAEVAKRLKLSDVAKVCVARAKDRLSARWSDGSAGFGPTEPEEEDAP